MNSNDFDKKEVFPNASDYYKPKTRIFVVTGRDGKRRFQKNYRSGLEVKWEKEQRFNELVEATSYPHKPRFFPTGVHLETVVEYIPGENLETHLRLGGEPNFRRVFGLLLEESRYLGKIDPSKLLPWDDPYLGTRRILQEGYGNLGASLEEELARHLEIAEARGGVLRSDPEASNILLTEDGRILTVDYAKPIIAHPIHNLLYLLTHFDLPKRAGFFEVRDTVVSQFAKEFERVVGEFILEPERVESTVRATMIHSFSINWLSQGSTFLREEDISDGTPSLERRLEALRKMLTLPYEELIRGELKFRR